MFVSIISPANSFHRIRINCKNVTVCEFPVISLEHAIGIKAVIEDGYLDMDKPRPLNEILKEGE